MESSKSSPSYLFLILIGLVAVVVKLPYIANPISDWHSWNQISVMAMTRYIFLDGWSAFWQPKVDLFEHLSTTSNLAFAEFPILEGVIAMFYHLFDGEAEWLARLVTIGFSVVGTIYFYLLVREETNEKTARIAVGMYLISPMVWFFHRAVMTDVVMVSFITAGMYHFRNWLNSESYKQILLCTVYTALAALSKAYGLYIGVAFLLMILTQWGWRKLFHPGHFLLLFGSCLPVLIWIWHGLGVVSDVTGRNLTGTTELLGPISIWWNPKYWLRLQSSLMDFTLLPLGNLGLIAAFVFYKKLWQHKIVLFWFAAVMFYFLFVRQGNMVHDYYQMPFAAPIILIAAIGWSRWSDNWKQKMPPAAYRALIGVIAVLCIVNGAKYAHTKAKLDMSPVILGKKINSLAASGEYVIIIDSDGLQRNQALFYANTHGWHLRSPLHPEMLEPYIKNGGSWIGLNMDDTDFIEFKPYLEAYDKTFSKVWEGTSADRYRKVKHLIIYRVEAGDNELL